jgi:hypothetical protein
LPTPSADTFTSKNKDRHHHFQHHASQRRYNPKMNQQVRSRHNVARFLPKKPLDGQRSIE